MADQLSLGFDPALPRAGSVAPMLPVPQRDPFDSGDHLFEPLWGGHRVLAFLEPGGGLRVVDTDGVDLAPLLPELAGLRASVDAHSAVLDGELVVVDLAGRLDDAALRVRLAGEAGRPVALLLFDLLHHDGAWLLGRPLETRRSLLRRILSDGDAAVVVPAVKGEGLALYDAVAAQGLAGVLARTRRSPYLPGVRSRLWRSIAVQPADAPGGRAPVGEAGGGGPVDAELEADPAGTAGPPVLTVLRRLPFDWD